MLKTHQLRSILQRLFLPFFETSKETRQKESEHTLHLSSNQSAWPSPFLAIYLNTLLSSSPCSGGRQSCLLAALSSPPKQLLAELRGGASPEALAPHNSLPGLRRPPARRAPESLCRGRRSQLPGRSPPCRGRGGGPAVPRRGSARPSFPGRAPGPARRARARGLRSRGCLRSQEPRRAPC